MVQHMLLMDASSKYDISTDPFITLILKYTSLCVKTYLEWDSNYLISFRKEGGAFHDNFQHKVILLYCSAMKHV